MGVPSGMAESGGGFVETVVLTDPLDPTSPRQAHGQAKWRFDRRTYRWPAWLAHRFRKGRRWMVAQAKSVV